MTDVRFLRADLSDVAVLAGFALASLEACTQPQRLTLQNAAGCYALQYGAWSRSVSGTPPSPIALDDVRPSGPLVAWSVNPLRARPNIPQSREPAPPAVWFVDTLGALHVLWTTGFSGYGVILTQQANGTLAGTMEAFSDSHPFPEPPPPTATVQARHISCAAAGL